MANKLIINPVTGEPTPAYIPQSNPDFDQQEAPVGQIRGNIWRERDVNRDVVQEWFWNGTYWLSCLLFNTHIPFGGLNNYSTTTQGQSFHIGNFNLYLIKFTGTFYSLGNLTDTDYWVLYFGSNFSTFYTLNIKVGNNGETFNFVTKTSPQVNSHYIPPAGGYLNFQFGKINNSPSIGSPTVIVEYRLARI